MSEINYLIKDEAYPFDKARKFIRRVRNASFYVFASFELPSDEEGKVYPMRESVQVSAKKMLEMLDHWEDFSNRKREADKNGVRGVPFSVSVWESYQGKTRHQVYMG